jgi:hypothetical protein
VPVVVAEQRVKEGDPVGAQVGHLNERKRKIKNRQKIDFYTELII